jgi:hypothetical protein
MLSCEIINYRRNLGNYKIITLTYKEEIFYDISEFGFIESTLLLTNSQTLSANKVFD